MEQRRLNCVKQQRHRGGVSAGSGRQQAFQLLVWPVQAPIPRRVSMVHRPTLNATHSVLQISVHTVCCPQTCAVQTRSLLLTRQTRVRQPNTPANLEKEVNTL